MKKKIAIPFLLALVMLLAVSFPVSGALDTSSDTYYVADDPDNYDVVNCSFEEAEMVRYNYSSGQETYEKIVVNEITSYRASNKQKYWPGYVPENLNIESKILERGIIDEDDEDTEDDDRKQITDTTVFPYSAITHLKATWSDGEITDGTAWFIDENVLITAAHNVYGLRPSYFDDPDNIDTSIPPEYAEIVLSPGSVNPTSSWYTPPYGTYSPSEVLVPTYWKTNELELYVFAIIILDDSVTVGNQTGYFSFMHYSNPINSGVAICGYGKRDNNPNHALLMYKDGGSVLDLVNGTLRYDIDTSKGQSGSPVYISGNIAIGIHRNDESIYGYNEGLAITESLYRLFMGYVD